MHVHCGPILWFYAARVNVFWACQASSRVHANRYALTNQDARHADARAAVRNGFADSDIQLALVVGAHEDMCTRRRLRMHICAAWST